MCEMLDRVMEMGRKEGIEQGIEQGIEKGIEQGIEKGKLQGYNAAKDEFMDSLLRKDEEIARLKAKRKLIRGNLIIPKDDKY